MENAIDINVELLVKDLLLEEECVVVPNFGGFVSAYRSAVIEPTKNIILPPSKKISFNAQLQSNDGFLAKAVSERCGLTYSDALLSIQKRVETWNYILHHQQYLEFDGLGSFVLNKEGNLMFQQFGETNFLIDAFGLKPIHALPIEQEGIAARIENEISKRKGKAKGKIISINRGMIKTAAAAAVVVGLTWIGYQNANQISEKYATLSMNWFSNETPNAQQEAQEIVVAGTDFEQQKAIETQNYQKFFEQEEKQIFEDLGHVGDHENMEVIEQLQKDQTKIEVEIPVVKEPVAVSKNIVSNSTLKYHVIGGCFAEMSNAEKMVQQLTDLGFEAHIAGTSKNGLHRVAYGSYATRVEALKGLAKAKLNHNSNAWLAKD